MPSDSSERRLTKPNQMGTPPSEPEKLPCPRCDSANTKFCYYNNYNFSQPRHFCKSCRRYWTHGGTLRDIPVGGCNRKNKRSRTLPAAASGVTSSSSPSGGAQSGQEYRRVAVPASTSQLLASLSGADPLPLSFFGDLKAGGNAYGSFTSLLSTHGPGLFAFGGIGLGFGTGLEEASYGLGRGGVRPYPGFGMGEVGPTTGTGLSLNGNHWAPLESEEETGHCFPYSSSGVARSMVSNNNFL